MIRSVCLAVLVGLAGCVIDSPVDELDLDLPERTVIVDTADWELTEEGSLPSVDCVGSPGICGDRVDAWCGADEFCEASCGAETCEVNVLVALWDTINLAQEKTQLAQLNGEPLDTVIIDEVSFTVSENTLNVTSPALTLSVAPAGVMSSSGRGAADLGIIPSLAPGETVDEEDVDLTPSGQTELADRMREYETPFNLVIGSIVQLRAGDPVPSGRLIAKLRVRAHASTGL
jgi:hypothetical protein